MAKTKDIFNAVTQQVETASLEVDNNGDIVATFDDGNFVKFPSVETPKDFETLVSDYQVNNEGQESAAAVEAAKEASSAVLDAVTVDDGSTPAEEVSETPEEEVAEVPSE